MSTSAITDRVDRVDQWKFEISSGYAGWRCTECGTWVYDDKPKVCSCTKKHEEKIPSLIQVITLTTAQVAEAVTEYLKKQGVSGLDGATCNVHGVYVARDKKAYQKFEFTK